MENIYGILLEPKRFAVHDGPGVRTTFFTKGCPLKCVWCHNPESIDRRISLAYMAHKCINCGECVDSCSADAHFMQADKHFFDFAKCTSCMNCADVCLGKALKIYGKKISVSEALQIALEDVDFYEESGGGVTISGGEPLLQSEFTLAFLAELKKNNIHTALDTCCFVSQEKLAAALPVTDIFLVDFKHFDSEKHRALTGQGNEIIKDNLRFLAQNNAQIEIRIPFVPSYNDDDENMENTAVFLLEIGIKNIRLLAYHDMARSKYLSLNMTDPMPHCEKTSEFRLERAAAVLKERGLNVMQ